MKDKQMIKKEKMQKSGKLKTKLLNEKQIQVGTEIIKSGGTVVFRTETVYGLGANATNEDAVKKIFEAKGRPAVNPLIVHFSSLKEVLARFPDIDNVTRMVLKKVKSAITVILSRPDWIPLVTTGGLETVAVRVPSCKFARKFIKACGVPLAAPSANTSTRPSPTRWQDAYEDLDGQVNAIFCGGATDIGLESTVVKVHADEIQVLRLGGICTKELSKKTGMKVEHNATNESPGTQFKHYAPSCPLRVVEDVSAFESLKNVKTIRCVDLGKKPEKKLFAIIRDAEKQCDMIVCEKFPNAPEYEAINDRLLRASAENERK